MKTTIEMARESGLQSEHGVSEFAYLDRLQHFEALVRADERAKRHLPDALTQEYGDSAQYVEGWNECREVMAEMMK